MKTKDAITIAFGAVTCISTAITVAVGINAIYDFNNNTSYNSIRKPNIKQMILDAKKEIEIYSAMSEKLKKESINIVGIITENTMNYNDMKQFDAKTWSDKLTVVNEAWRNAEVQKKFYETRLDVLTSKLAEGK